MTLDQLVSLRCIVETGSFKAASEALHKTQPSISVAIKNLETELGVKIFNRSTYRPSLTKEGQSIYYKAIKVLEDAENLANLGKHLSQGVEAEIKIAIDAVCPRQQIYSLLQKFFETEACRLTLKITVLGAGAEELKNQEADIAIGPILKSDILFDAYQCSSIRMIPVASKKLFNKSKLSVQELKEKPQIILQSQHSSSKNFSFGVLNGGRHWLVNDGDVKKDLILAGLGWGSLPSFDIEPALKKKQLLMIQNPQLPVRDMPMYITTRQGSQTGPKTAALLKYLIKNLK